MLSDIMSSPLSSEIGEVSAGLLLVRDTLCDKDFSLLDEA